MFGRKLPSLLLISLIIGSSSAFAQIPLVQVLESSAGRYIFGELGRGSWVASQVLGGEVAASERSSAILHELSRPEMSAVAERMESRLIRIRDRFVDRHGEASAEVFSNAAGRALNAEEIETLRTLVNQELDVAFIRLIPERQGAANFAANREAFLSAQQANPPIGTSQTPTETLRNWVQLASRGGTAIDQTIAAASFDAYEALLQAHPELSTLLPKSVVTRMLVDEEMSLYPENFRKVMSHMTANTAEISPREKLEAAIREVLVDQVPASSIEARVRGLRTGSPIALRRALGEMSLKEAQLLLHGGNPLAPTADSLIGKYLAETGATTVIRTFSKGDATAVAGPGQGPQRLVVAVSEGSFATYLKYFSRKNLLAHLHTPSQGTLMLAYNGKTGSYANNGMRLRAPSSSAILPTIVLSTSEGQRAYQYFQLGELGEVNSEYARHPWHLAGSEANSRYCATGGYNSCTHWFGNIPLGDKLVTEYKFPGRIDQHASNIDPPTNAPRVQALRPYVTSTDPLVRRVWKVPGHEQLADVLGLQAQNLAGEFANPGWVANALLGAASVDRVPVVFRMVADVRTPMVENFNPMINAY